jgi:uncharacterized membrane protein YfcA
MDNELLIYLGFGSVAGILSGLFGIGGGVVIVPFLAVWFQSLHFPENSIMLMAVATSLATIVATSISAVVAHHRRGAIAWPTVIKLAPGLFVGAIFGSLIARVLPVAVFKLFFGFFMLQIALRMLLPKQGHSLAPISITRGRLIRTSLLIGTVSSILGIGGGTLTVPFLSRCGCTIRQAVAISSASGFPIALAGVATYIILGFHKSGVPSPSLGYVYLPAFSGIVTSSVLFAPLGAHLAHNLPVALLNRCFAVVMIMVGVKLLWQGFQQLA